MNLFLDSDEAMRAFGARLAHACPANCVIYLFGELGAGKSTLVRGFLKALGHEGAVKSPTYTLVEPYEVAGKNIYHLDLYRLADPEELEFLGVRDWLENDAILLAEWPQQGRGVMPEPDLTISLSYNGEGRDASVESHTDVGASILNGLDA